jgi:beta-ureidopropionase / N-carbamoyl-L-amino-acid hydrolase
MPGSNDAPTAERFAALWASVASIGRDGDSGGYLRPGWSPAELACREWFAEEAADRDLDLRPDGNGNLFAWWGAPDGDHAADRKTIVTGSHFDSVPHGGAYDGPLGIVSALLAVDLLRERGVRPHRPIAVAAFAEEEGSRFGVACLGSRLLTGAIAPHRALELTDRAGVSLAEAVSAADGEPDELGPDPELVGRIGAFIELHIEQGRGLVELAAPVGVASAIWPHGRWRFDLTGEANHAGTTRMADRRDPMLTYAETVLAAHSQAASHGAHATVGRASVLPNATNAIASRVSAWRDARAAEQATLDAMVASIVADATVRAESDGVAIAVIAESVSGETIFHEELRDRLVARLSSGAGGTVPVLATGAGHDAGVLAAAGVPTAMLFVRNPTGVSHAPAEHATDADCAAGVAALADVLEELACQ